MIMTATNLKSEFSTQRQIEAQFDSWERSERNEKLKLGLFDLISNVLLFEVRGSDGRNFHFRFALKIPPHTKTCRKTFRCDLRISTSIIFSDGRMISG